MHRLDPKVCTGDPAGLRLGQEDPWLKRRPARFLFRFDRSRLPPMLGSDETGLGSWIEPGQFRLDTHGIRQAKPPAHELQNVNLACVCLIQFVNVGWICMKLNETSLKVCQAQFVFNGPVTWAHIGTYTVNLSTDFHNSKADRPGWN